MGDGQDLNAMAVLLASIGIAFAMLTAGAVMLLVERRARAARLRAAVSRRSGRVAGAGAAAPPPPSPSSATRPCRPGCSR